MIATFVTVPAVYVDLPAVEPLDIVDSTARSTYLIVCSRSDVIFFITITLVISELMVNGLIITNPEQVIQLSSISHKEKYAETQNDISRQGHYKVE